MRLTLPVFLSTLPFIGIAPLAAEVDYGKSVKPLLKERCYSCHGGLKQKAGLRLDTVAGMLIGGDEGPALAPGDAGKSHILNRILATDLDERMPPKHEGEPFTTAQAQLLREWIAGGAKGPVDEKPESDPREHWAFRQRVRPPVPEIENAAWANNPIDAFIARQHQKHGILPQKQAPREVLIRRLYLDLIGIPPTPAEIAATENDDGWYDSTVNRLLNDPRHGERWARHWMDIWRYSDWWGLGDQLRNSQKHMWHWRDWIVESLNANLPYDEMLRQMLAADELYPADPQKLRATGFLARNFFLFNRNPWMEETVEHVSKGLLGLTMNCTKCHDHKYDPITQVDYYRMRAFFEPVHVRLDAVPGETEFDKNGIPRVFDGLPSEPTFRYIRGEESKPDKSAPIAPGVPALLEFAPLEVRPVELPLAGREPERNAWVMESHLAAAQKKNADAKDGRGRELAKAELEGVEARIRATRAEWSGGDAREDAIRAEQRIAVVNARHAVADAEAILEKADAQKKPDAEKKVTDARDKVVKSEKALTEPVKPDAMFTRFAGAQWTPTRFKDSTKDDPRIGFPASSTGRRSALAAWITDTRNLLSSRVAVNHIWTRHMGQPLVATMFDFGRKGAGPTHPELLDWLASELVESGWDMRHIHRLIVTSATYRMSSSLLGAEASVARDPDNHQMWHRLPQRIESEVVRDSLLALAGELDTTLGGPSIPPAAQDASKRRSLYFFHSNIEKNRFLSTFDAADVKDCYRRDQSIVPQQALAMSNSALVHNAAEKIAARITNAAPDESGFVRAAWMQILAITPNEAEFAASTRSLAEWRALPGGNDTTARTHLVRALLSHNDFVTLR